MPVVALAAGFVSGLVLALLPNIWQRRGLVSLVLLSFLPVLYVVTQDRSIVANIASALEFLAAVVAFLLLPAAAAGALGYATSCWLKRARRFANRFLSGKRSIQP